MMRFLKKGFPALSVILATAFLTSSSYAQDILLKNAQIVDPSREIVTRGHILIHGESILAISYDLPPQITGQTLDLKGAWVIPGLIDMHDHSWGNPSPSTDSSTVQRTGTQETARLMLSAGITAFLDLGSDEDLILSLRNQLREKKIVGAEIHAAGPVFAYGAEDQPDRSEGMRTIRSPEEARTQVKQLGKKHPDVIKILYGGTGRMKTISQPTLEAVIQAAHESHLKTIVHIGNWKNAREAVLSGTDVITHLDDEQEIPDDLVALMHQRKTYLIPTMAVQSDLLTTVEHPLLLDNPLLRSVTAPALRNAYRDSKKFNPKALGWLEWQKKSKSIYQRTLKKLVAGKIKLLAGSDSGNIGTFQGFSLHRELELWTEAGVPAWQALAAATTVPGSFLGKAYGIHPGDLANLVILNSNPIPTIQNTQQIRSVFHRGKAVDLPSLKP